MSNKLYEENDVQAIANAIRTKNGSSDTYMVSEMAQAVLDIPTGTTPTGAKSITISASGTTTSDVTNYASVEITTPQGAYTPSLGTTVTPSISVSNTGLITASNLTMRMTDLFKDTFVEGYVKASDVSASATATGGSATQQLNTVSGQTVTPTTSTQYIAVQGDYVLGAINVAPIPSQYIIPTGTKQITANGTGIDVKDYEFVDVSVSGGSIGPILDGSVTSVSDSTITKLHHSVFRGCNQLASVDFPNVTTLGSYDFYNCTSLTSVNLPKASNEVGNSFYGCTALQTIVLPSMLRTGTSFAQGCTHLLTVDFGVAERFAGNTFNGCSRLTTMILRKSSVLNLSSTNVLTGTPFASGGSGGTIYVPSSLISSYKTASNWSTFEGYGTITWKAIENSQYENYYADGTPIS